MGRAFAAPCSLPRARTGPPPSLPSAARHGASSGAACALVRGALPPLPSRTYAGPGHRAPTARPRQGPFRRSRSGHNVLASRCRQTSTLFGRSVPLHQRRHYILFHRGTRTSPNVFPRVGTRIYKKVSVRNLNLPSRTKFSVHQAPLHSLPDF